MMFRSVGRVALALAFSLGLATLPTSCGGGGGHAIGFTYVLASNPCAIYLFNINSVNGALSAASTPSLDCPSGTSDPVAAVVSPDYKFLFVLFGPSGASGTIQAYSINQNNGNISALASYSTAGNNSTALAIDPNGNYIYAVDNYGAGLTSGTGVLSFYKLASGVLSAPSCTGGTVVASACGYPVGYNPSGVTQLFNASFVYVTNSGLASLPCVSSNVSGYAVAAAGLTPIVFSVPRGACPGGAAPVPAGTLPMGVQPVGIATDPSSSFVFITDFQQNEVFSNQVDPNTGNLSTTITGGTTGQGFPTGAIGPRNIIVDPRGQYVYISNTTSGYISAFTLSKVSGTLTAVSGSPYLAGAGPQCLGIEQLQGDFLFASNLLSGSVSGYKLTGNTGQLAGVPNQPFQISTSSGSAPTCLVTAANGPTPLPGTP